MQKTSRDFVGFNYDQNSPKLQSPKIEKVKQKIVFGRQSVQHTGKEMNKKKDGLKTIYPDMRVIGNSTRN